MAKNLPVNGAVPPRQNGRRRLGALTRRILDLAVGQCDTFARVPHPKVRATASWLSRREGRRYETRVDIETRAIAVWRVS